MAATTCELWVCVSDQEEYETGTTAQDARDRFEEQHGALNERDGFRLYKVTLTVPLPAPVELTGEVKEAEAEPATLTVA